MSCIKNVLMKISLFVLFAVLMFLPVSAQEYPKKDNPYIDENGNPVLINFENGDFEQPETTVVDIPGATNTAAQMLTGKSGYFPMEAIPGWYTEPVADEHVSNAYAHYIEIQLSGHQAGVDVYDGVQMAELNASVPGVLYQVCPTIGGQKVYWEFYHRGRESSTVPDVMEFHLYGLEGAPGERSILQGLSDSSRQGIGSTTNAAWKRYYGAYTVPDGQDYTVFAYKAVSSSNDKDAYGNYIDGISFTYPSFLEVELQAEAIRSEGQKNFVFQNERVKYTIEVSNTGEKATSRTKLTYVLPSGLSFDENSLFAVYQDKDGNQESLSLSPGQWNFDNSKNELTIELGKEISGAKLTDENGNEIPNTYANGTCSIENGGTVILTLEAAVTGNGLTRGDILKHQARVVYNDLGFEEYNRSENGELNDEDNASDIIELIYMEKVSVEIDKQITAPASEAQRFLFRLDYRETPDASVRKSFYAEVPIAAGDIWGQCVLQNLYPGDYTVTELTGNWLYQIDNPANREQNEYLDGESGLYWNPVYRNEYKENNLISGSTAIINYME